MATKFYYGYEYTPANDTDRIEPAPLVSITQNPFYVGENFIGYNYTVEVQGTAAPPPSGTLGDVGITSVMTEIEKVMTKRFNKNGAILYVEFDGQPALRCMGSKLISIEVQPTNNLWVNYASYTAVIEFNEVDFIGCDNRNGTCPNIHARNYTPELIEPKDYKIKSFSDSWDIQTGQELYQAIGEYIANQYYNVTYTLEAEGYHFFNAGNDSTTRKHLIPAWEQAKNFCQDRLYEQIQRLNPSNPTLLQERSTGDTTTTPQANSTPENLFNRTGINPTIFLDTTQYAVYNEKVKTSASESNGRFSLEYTCIIKRHENNGTLPSHRHVLHNITTTKNVSDTSSRTTIGLEVQGEIQGLIPGGLHALYNRAQLELSSNGVMIYGLNSTETKYDYAKEVYESIVTPYDLTLAFKNYLGITFSVFGITCSSSEGPLPSTMNSSHSFSEGKISYTATYDSTRVCQGAIAFTETTIELTDKVEPIAEHVVPGRANGPVIQNLNTTSPRKISLRINGYFDDDCCFDFSDYATATCNGTLLASYLPPVNVNGAVLTENNTTINPLDGSFNVSRSYTYYDL